MTRKKKSEAAAGRRVWKKPALRKIKLEQRIVELGEVVAGIAVDVRRVDLRITNTNERITNGMSLLEAWSGLENEVVSKLELKLRPKGPAPARGDDEGAEAPAGNAARRARAPVERDLDADGPRERARAAAGAPVVNRVKEFVLDFLAISIVAGEHWRALRTMRAVPKIREQVRSAEAQAAAAARPPPAPPPSPCICANATAREAHRHVAERMRMPINPRDCLTGELRPPDVGEIEKRLREIFGPRVHVYALPKKPDGAN